MPKANKIYLDHAATTPVSKKAMDAMRPYFSSKFGNPSSIHILGQQALGALDEARADVAALLGCSRDEVIFTSSATFSINAALRGVVKTALKSDIKTPHIVTANTEHSAVLNTCEALEAEGAEVTYLPADSEGFISPKQVKDALKENTVLVSVGYVNNEIGTIQPIAEIANIIRDLRNSKFEIQNSKLKMALPFFHTDAVQAANYLDINVKNLEVDLMTLSSHKIYGPKGAALLYRRKGIELEPVIAGGPQERGLYPGTENIPAIIGFAEALKEAQGMREKEAKRLSELRDYFIDNITGESPKITLNGPRENRAPNNVNLCFEDRPSETLIPALDAKGIYASGGSACTARAIEPSHVIEALGRPECAKTSLRLTLGRGTKKGDIDKAAKELAVLAER